MAFWQNTAAKPHSLPHLGKRQRRDSVTGRIGTRLVIQILVANAILSIFAASVQLFASYQRDRTEVLSTIAIIDNSFRTSFESALWTYNFPLVEALLDGVINKTEVKHLRLVTEHGQKWQRGTDGGKNIARDQLTFFHTTTSGQQVVVGKLHVVLTLEHVHARIWSQIWVLILSNFVKSLCASIMMLFIVDRNVTRHLHMIADHVSKSSWFEQTGEIVLDRKPSKQPDELDHIAHTINAAKSKAGKDFQALENEIQRRRVVETLLRQRGDALKHANEEQAEFSYALSHDMKSPANTLRMLLSELEEIEGERLGPDGTDVLQDCQLTVTRMLRLIEDVLDYASMVNSTTSTTSVDLNVLVADILLDIKSVITNVQAKIIVGALPVIDGHPTQLRMLIQNLIVNAIKFRAPDTVPVVNVSASSPGRSDKVVLSVTDNGIGIDPDFHQRIFGLFQRLHTHSTFAGSGLGLAICKRIATNHGGSIDVTSSLGNGSQFNIHLPGRHHNA